MRPTPERVLISTGQKKIRRHLQLNHYYPNMITDEIRREGLHIGKLSG